jgi:hypothetical protein
VPDRLESGPRSRRLTGGFTVAGPVEAVFPLFSPLGEKLWVPGWDPELLHPADVEWEAGMIFRTRERTGDAIWLLTRLDRAAHEVEYFRVEPGLYSAKVAVRCGEVPGGFTRVATSYEFVALTPAGGAEIDRMSAAAFDDKMRRWQEWIGVHLANEAGRQSAAGPTPSGGDGRDAADRRGALPAAVLPRDGAP